jgi:4Fe-4S ferredoxin
MVMQLLRKQTEEKLLVERIIYTKRYSLILDKERCVGCETCRITCPREAITVVKPVKITGGKLKKPTVIIDETKCSFCGICTTICPFGALTLMVNSEIVVPVLEKEAFPKFIHEVLVEESRCPMDCIKCEEACPFNLIKVTANKATGSVKVEIDKMHCPGCRLCEVKCPYNAITVRKVVTGTMTINKAKCPDNCHDCVDVCPVPGVLSPSDDGKVEVNDTCCIYCGVCKVVCPVEEALHLQRDSVHHTPVHSGAWNKALEKLTTTHGVTKELMNRSSEKARQSVKRLFNQVTN